jgi:hypothetical protein
MLFYLDNWLSADPAAAARVNGACGARPRPDAAPTSRPRRRGGARPTQRPQRELRASRWSCTLGVDGGYTQKDVTEVARAFTGWTIRGLRQDAPVFAFDQRLHDDGGQLVLGQTVKGRRRGGGAGDPVRLATSPATARFTPGSSPAAGGGRAAAASSIAPRRRS